MGITASKVIEIAKGEIGYLEKASNYDLDSKTGNAGKANYTKYARDLYAAGYYNGNKNGYEWCDVFADWCFYMAAGKNKAVAEAAECQTGDCGAGCTFSAQYYKKAGRFFSSPKVGDQIFFGDLGDEEHTGIVIAVADGRVYTIEGNTSAGNTLVSNGGGVAEKSYYLNSPYIAGYGRPIYEEENTVTIELNVLKKGSSGTQVKTLQMLLIANGFGCGASGADGDFGSATLKAVEAYQKANNLDVDGSVGPKTWTKLLKG